MLTFRSPPPPSSRDKQTYRCVSHLSGVVDLNGHFLPPASQLEFGYITVLQTVEVVCLVVLSSDSVLVTAQIIVYRASVSLVVAS